MDSTHGATENSTAARAAIRVAVYDENVSIRDKVLHPGPYNIVACLSRNCWDSCSTACSRKVHAVTQVTLISPRQIREGRLSRDQFDVVVFPGGSAKRQSKNLQSDGLRAVRSFVEGGGGYVRRIDSPRIAMCHNLMLCRSSERRLFRHIEHWTVWYLRHLHVYWSCFCVL